MQDSATSFTQASWKDSRWMMWALVTVVSADSLLRVFAKWRSYDYLTRADAAVFALLLLAFPGLILGFRSGKHMETEQIVVFVYIIILMLVTMLGH